MKTDTNNSDKAIITITEDSSHKVDLYQCSILIKKVDWRIQPILFLTYFLSFLDRAHTVTSRSTTNNNNNSEMTHSTSEDDIVEVQAVDDIDTTLGLSSTQVKLTYCIFFVGYVLCEVPSNVGLKKYTPSLWLARIMVTWGLTCFLVSFVQDFIGLFVLRLLLGIFEAGFFPGVLYYLTFWYSHREMAFRIALFLSSSCLSGIFGSLIVYAITTFMDSLVFQVNGWRWLFAFEGFFTIVFGIFVWYCLPNYPDTCSFLNSVEKDVYMLRMKAANATMSTEKTFDKVVFYSTLLDPKTYVYSLIYFCISCTMYSFSFALPNVLSSMGFSPSDLLSHCLPSPPYLVALFTLLFTAYLSDRLYSRLILVVIFSLLTVVGYCGMALVDDITTKYIFSILVCSSTHAVCPPFLAYISENTKGATQRAVVIGMVVAAGNVGGAIIIFLYDKSLSSTMLGNAANAGLSLLAIILTGLLKFI